MDVHSVKGQIRKDCRLVLIAESVEGAAILAVVLPGLAWLLLHPLMLASQSVFNIRIGHIH